MILEFGIAEKRHTTLDKLSSIDLYSYYRIAKDNKWG
jgi:hypothetical protein